MTDLVSAAPLVSVLGLDPLAWVALGLALAGVVGSAVPLVPGALLGLSGVLLYWYSTGYGDPGPVALVLLTGLGVVVVVVDWLAGALSATVGGASTRTAVLAGLAGFVLFFVVGPLGVLLGVAGVVFLSELQGGADAGASARTALVTTVGMLGSAVAQVLLTAVLFLGLVAVVVL